MCKRKSLLQYINSSKNASLLYHKILALPLLPPELIQGAFIEIKSKILLMDSDGTFLPFLKYFDNYWIHKVNNHMSIFKTNFQNKINLMIGWLQKLQRAQ